MNYIIGLDPSYKGFGIAYYDIKNKKFKTAKLVVDYTTADFKSVTIATKKMLNKFWRQIFNEFEITLEGSEILMESPPPSSQSSSRLYALDTALANLIIDAGASLSYCAPNYIGHLHHNMQWKKSESVFLERNLKRKLKELGYDLSEVSEESNQAEAFLLLIACIQKSVHKIQELDCEEFKMYKDCHRYQYSIERSLYNV